jgi:endonuclease-3 related protein
MTLRDVYDRLYAIYGPQHWWPADSPFEVMLGAVLTQNTTWRNVEQAMRSLLDAGCQRPRAILATPLERLAKSLRPCGYFNVKAARLRNLCIWYIEQGGWESLRYKDTLILRRQLLAIKGIGPETADDILLYAFERPVFVIDAYTRRLFARLGFIRGHEGYEDLRADFEHALGADTVLYNEYHALIVRHAKEICRVRPQCVICDLAPDCPEPSREGLNQVAVRG